MSLVEVYKKYHSAGFACVPTGKNKAPAVPKGVKITGNWEQLTEYESAHGIGLICGNGLECLDFDNHFGDADQRFKDFFLNPDIIKIYENNRFCVQETVNGGFHVIYKTPAVNGSEKLASRVNNKGKQEALIETRGTGNYFCCDPTPGYKIIWNDILNLPTIATEDRDILLEVCKSYNEVTTIKKAPAINNNNEERIGDIFNRSPEAIREMTGALEGAGWTEIETNKWKRPGKERGISATLNIVAPGLFHNFSANGDPFEMDGTYSPFQVVAMLKYHGDNKAFAKELHERYKPLENKSAPPAMAELEKRLCIDLSKEPEAAPAILYYQQIPFACLQDFTLITGKAKVRKTFLSVFLTASYLGYRNDLIFNDTARQGTVLWFDTEQSPHYFFKTLKRVCRMTGQETPRLKGYNLKTLTPGQKTDFIEYVIKNTPNVQLVVIDGIRDLVFDINSPEEATKTSVRLMQWCAENNLHIICILHQNKGDGNARGHLGTELVNKAQTVLSVSLEAGNKTVSSVEGEYTRDLDFPGFSFIVNDDSLPQLCDTPQEDRTIKRTDPNFISNEVHWKVLNEAYRELREQKYKESCTNIKLEFAQNGIYFGENKAREYLAYYIKNGWISKNDEKKSYIYERAIF